jgi:hypothetical protein
MDATTVEQAAVNPPDALRVTPVTSWKRKPSGLSRWSLTQNQCLSHGVTAVMTSGRVSERFDEMEREDEQNMGRLG